MSTTGNPPMAAAKATSRKRLPAPSGGLRYSRDGEKGYLRRQGDEAFEYVDAAGER